MELTWFRAPTDGDAGATNLCYHALDAQVVHGRAGEAAVRHADGEVDYATLLERVSALAGAMKGVGVTSGAAVGVLLDEPLDQVLALLACLRIGAVHVTLPEDDPAATIDRHEPSLVLTSQALVTAAHAPAVVFLRGPEVQDDQREVDWDIAVKAGRTDPASAEPVAGDATAYVTDRPVAVREVPGDDSAIARLIDDLAQGRALEPGTTRREATR